MPYDDDNVLFMRPVEKMLLVGEKEGHMASSNSSQIVPRYRLNSFGRRCFAVAGPSTWNSLTDTLSNPALSLNIFRRQLKTLFCEILTRCTERIRDFFENALYELTLYFILLYSTSQKFVFSCRPGLKYSNCRKIGWVKKKQK